MHTPDTPRPATHAAAPQPVRDAFVPLEPLRVGDLDLHPLTLGTLILLEQLDSPLVDLEGTAEVSVKDLAEALYVLTRHLPASRAVLARGREAFDTAVMELANQIPAGELLAVGQKVRDHLAATFGMFIPSQPEEAGEKKTQTPNPSAPPGLATASAGA